MDVPIVETERLRLRGHRPEDLQACWGMWGDPAVTRFIAPNPFSREDVWARLLRYAGHWAWLGYGYWAVEEKATGHFVGEVGFADFRREMTPGIEGVPEIGWVLAGNAHGLGYATEAVRSVVRWGDRQFGEARTVCLIHPENRASIRVAEKCGYAELWRTVYRNQSTVVFGRGR